MTKEFDYKIKKSRKAKYIRLAIHSDASVVLTVPWFVPSFLYKKFIQDKKEWVLKKISERKDREENIIKRTRRDYLSNKSKAIIFIRERLEFFNKFYGFSYKKISIRDQKTRWGSCSRNENLSFNYRLIFLPKEMSDYIIVHELCHLKEMNHSRRFWSLVAKAIPDYLAIRKKLKKNGMCF